MLKTPIKAFHSILTAPTNNATPSQSQPTTASAAPTLSNAAASTSAPPPPFVTSAAATTATGTTTGPLPVPITADASSLLNKSVTSSTGIYQQSVFLRSQLQRIPAFTAFFQFSISGSRASKDVVQQLWETFSLGKPLCVLFNLQDIPPEYKIVEYADEEVDPDPLRKERQRAIALFIMGVNNLKMNGQWGSDAPLFSISELVGDTMDTNGFVKVVATVIHLLSRFLPTVWADKPLPSLTVPALPPNQPGGQGTTATTSSKDMERRNLVRELIETERKYCQDLEIMQSYADSLRKRDIVDADTIHRLFPALGKLTDFQRKLLIHMESMAENGLDDQDWGLCFSLHEPEFAIYDAYIANYSQALDLALAEKTTLTAASDIINPAQLPAFLIKPVQRLCRYPMLLGSLLKLTPAEHRLHDSLAEGVGVVKRIADAANRALREKENEETWASTVSRIKDWKGLQLDSMGPMLLDDVFHVRNERRAHAEYHIFLFNRLLLLCRPKETPPEPEPSDKEKKSDRLTPGFMRSASSASANSALSPTAKNPPVSLVAGGAIASRRAKTPLSVRGALYIRNILEVTTETSGSYAITLKYSDRHEIMNWTISCRNEEQVNLWETEINRLLLVWAKQEVQIRKQAKMELKVLATTTTTNTNTTATAPQNIISPQEALDSLRSAKRPAHPYQYTFGSVPTRNRNRNGSLDLNTLRPDLFSAPRLRSSSVSSMASDHFDAHGRDDSSSVGSISTNASMVDLLVDSSSAALGSRSINDADLVDARSKGRQRTTSEVSRASVESEKRSYAPPPPPSSSNLSQSGRLRILPLPPQPPPPTIPQPPVPTETSYLDVGTNRRSHSHHHHHATEKSNVSSGEDTRPLPVPPAATSQLRQRVGLKAPAPLGPLAAGDATPSTSLTPQSTLPELPSRDVLRPLSSRKSGTILRGPREKPYSTASPPATPPLDPPAYGYSSSSSLSSSIHQRRSRSSSLLGGGGTAATESVRPLPPVKKHSSIRKRHGSISSNTDSTSNFTSSEDQEVDISPRTPSSFGDDANKASPSKFVFNVNGQRYAHPPPRYPEVVGSRPPSSRGQHVLVSSAGVNVDYPSTGVTPKTAFHETKDRELILSGGLVGHAKTPSESARQHAFSGTGNVGGGQESGKPHSRTNSSSGFGRTPAATSGTSSGSGSSEAVTVIVRLHHNDSKFLIKLPHSSSRVEFVEKVRKKIRLCGAAPPESLLLEHLPTTRFAPEEQVSFLDENYRFSKLTSNEDFLAAWKSVTRPRRDPEDTGVFILAVGPTSHLDYGKK
ncbi:hypothetical protein FRC17_001521 [Serendipita sp. 399]|nr:hypothetical protein FRC17_001521 [Serendipita sp. 399]